MKNACLVLLVAMTMWYPSSAQYPYLEIKVSLGEKEYRISTQEMKIDFNDSSNLLNIKFDLNACNMERVAYDSIGTKQYLPYYNQPEYQGKIISGGIVEFAMTLPGHLKDTTLCQPAIICFQDYETKIESVICNIRQIEKVWLFTLSFEEVFAMSYDFNSPKNNIKIESSFYIK